MTLEFQVLGVGAFILAVVLGWRSNRWPEPEEEEEEGPVLATTKQRLVWNGLDLVEDIVSAVIKALLLFCTVMAVVFIISLAKFHPALLYISAGVALAMMIIRSVLDLFTIPIQPFSDWPDWVHLGWYVPLLWGISFGLPVYIWWPTVGFVIALEAILWFSSVPLDFSLANRLMGRWYKKEVSCDVSAM